MFLKYAEHVPILASWHVLFPLLECSPGNSLSHVFRSASSGYLLDPPDIEGDIFPVFSLPLTLLPVLSAYAPDILYIYLSVVLLPQIECEAHELCFISFAFCFISGARKVSSLQ